MKKTFKNKILGLICLVFSVAAMAESSTEEATEASISVDVNYFYGYSFGNMLKEGGLKDVDLDELLLGLEDSVRGQPSRLSTTRQQEVFQQIRNLQALAQKAAEDKRQAHAQANLQKAEAFLADNQLREGVMKTSSGLQYEKLKDEPGPTATPDNVVVVNYKGTFADGTIFDQSGDSPARFGLTQVIPGWTEALQLMSAGDRFKLYLHPSLAYGAGGVGSIPANSLLIFEVELLSIEQP